MTAAATGATTERAMTRGSGLYSSVRRLTPRFCIAR